MAEDASTRRYFRLTHKNGQTAVLMDAAPEAGQDTAIFARLGADLNGRGLSAPRVLAEDHALGFLLLEDLGDGLIAQLVEERLEQETPLYAAAVDVLIALDGQAPPPGLPALDPATLGDMIEPAYTWYRRAVAGAPGGLLSAASGEVKAVFQDLPNGIFALRDYHAENLIWLPDRTGNARVGLLDFQDAVCGPVAYDLASLLLDARRDVSRAVIEAMLDRFATGTNRDKDTVRTAFAAVGVQRNLRILGVFTRLALLHGKPRYLDFLPRVWRYVESNLRHPALAGLAARVLDDLPVPTDTVIEDLKRQCDAARQV
ncbi:putative phosphotransferase [Candidatus Rhodobacter oscarellae]|uniref:Putative phosphotransferase n=1 Tax=Candidatus Rhodobacter oscarellae TaxID=1675527 RepID=A0A0J9E861_9RHOB|nr:phosphotransferase [Candidatus Rhodobacter lobularis]KMW58921.1 putative phosphotransferase [Candidatus Rhodobacter lobularis]